MQTKATVRAADDSRDRLQKLLRKMGRKYNSFGLMQLANSSVSDPFEKIRGLIETMIKKLQKQAQDEATHDAFCKEETKKSNASRERKSATADKIQARIDQAKAAKQQLHNEVAELMQEISDIEKSNASASSLRSTENGNYKKAVKDFKEAIEAISQAMVVLKDFYRGNQTVSHAALALNQQPDFGATRGDAGHSIIEILEVSMSDFSRLLAEAETGEAEAVKAYETLTQDNKVAKATKKAAVKGKNSEIKAIEVSLNNLNEDFATVSKELDAVIEYIAKLKPQCENKAMSYEERKARRDDEITGLKEALDILGADAALIQTRSTKFLSK
jgi:archaellum component FlaC